MMDDWFYEAEEDEHERYCFARRECLQTALEQPKVLDALMVDLGVPGKPAANRRLPAEKKVEAIAKEIAYRCDQPTSMWYEAAPLEVLAGELWMSRLAATPRAELWPKVRKEADLLAPIAADLREQDMEVYAEIPMGRKRIDVLGHRQKGWFRSEKVWGVELKNELSQLKRGLDQMTTFAQYSTRIYLACTPALGAQFLAAHAKARGVMRWDPEILSAKLERAGIGLWLVEGNEVFEVLEAPDTDIDDPKMEELMEHLRSSAPLPPQRM